MYHQLSTKKVKQRPYSIILIICTAYYYNYIDYNRMHGRRKKLSPQYDINNS